MMPNVFVVSDTHFSHQGMCEFTNPNGTKLRPLWTNCAQMDEDMVKWWNDTVNPSDKVYHLGDVAISKSGIRVMARLNGRKVLVKGNHDVHKPSHYAAQFYDVRAYHKLEGMLLSHIPIHPHELGRFKVNVHGHMHCATLGDPRYMNVCVEQINYRPIELSALRERIASRTLEAI